MKKLSALLMALVLCLTAFAACAEVELLETEQGLTIAIPTGWRQLELVRHYPQELFLQPGYPHAAEICRAIRC